MNTEYLKKIESVIVSPVAGKGHEVEMFKVMLDNPAATLDQYKSKCPAGVKNSTITTRFKLDKIVLSSVAVTLSKEGLLGNVTDAIKGIILAPSLGTGLQTIAIGILSGNPTISDTEFKTTFVKLSREANLIPAEATILTYYRDMRFRVQQAIKAMAVLPVPIALPENTATEATEATATATATEAMTLPAGKVSGKGKGKGSK